MFKTKTLKIAVITMTVLTMSLPAGAGKAISFLTAASTFTQTISPTNTILTPTNSTTFQQLVVGPNCKATILSETPGASSSDKYNVEWSMNVNGISSSIPYKINYGWNDVLTYEVTNSPYNPNDPEDLGLGALNLPHIVPAEYTLTSSESSRSVKLSMTLTNLSSGAKYSNSCSITLTNHNQNSSSGVLTQTNSTITNMNSTLTNMSTSSSPALTEVIAIPSPTNQVSPSYSFSSNKAGTLTYGGGCSADKATAVVGNNVIVLNPLTPGTYSSCTITLTDSSGNKSPALIMSSFTVRDSSTSSSTNTSNTTTGSTTTGSTTTGSSTTAGDSTATGAESSAGTEQTAPELKSSPDIMSSRIQAQILYFENDQPAYDRIPIMVTVTMPSLVTVSVYQDAYDPKSEDNSGSLIKTLITDVPKEKGSFTLTWDGYDEYDQAAPLGKYKFVVEAKPNATYKPDVSIQSFEIQNPPSPPETTATSAENVQEETLRGAAPETPQPGLLEQVSTAIFGEEKTVTEETAEVQKEPSKCPGVYYPIDIAGSPYESLIKKAYDECIISGYPDFTVRHQQYITRPEFIKMGMKAFGLEAKKGCYDADCGAGAPFTDMDLWMGPWVRAAWDFGFVKGIAPDKLGVGLINKAEVVTLTVRMAGIPPHQGCYTPNCGAGYPDNLFKDITQSWQGPYLRAAWDKGLIQAEQSGEFFPNQFVSRVQALDLLMRARSLK